MRNAYVVEIKTPQGTRYLGESHKLKSVPKFFVSWAHVKGMLSRNYGGYGSTYYGQAMHADTKVLVISDLDNGMKTSKVQEYTRDQFLATNFSKKAAASNPNSVFKLQRADGSYTNIGYTYNRHGKTWNRAGDLRAHLGRYVRFKGSDPFEAPFGRYAGAKVIEIVYSEDKNNLMPEQIIKHDAKEFYLLSPTCRTYYDKVKASK